MTNKIGAEPPSPPNHKPAEDMLTNQTLTPASKPRGDGNRASAPAVHDHIARRLKDVYDDILSQPVPDRFLGLLKDLEANSSSK